MAKFCTKCGKPLEDGKKCSCTEKKKVESNINIESLKEYGNLFFEVMKGIFKKPVDTIKKYSTKENFVFGCIAILVNSILFGILLYCFLREGLSFTNHSIGYGHNLFTITTEIPFFKTFLSGIVFMMIGLLVSGVSISLIGGSIFKANVDFKKTISLIGVCSVFTSITMLGVILFIFLSIKLALFLFLIAGMFYFTYLYQGLCEITNIKKNHLAYVFVSSICITIFVVFYVLPRILF